MKLFMTNSDEVFPGLRDTDISDVNVMECIQRTDGEFNTMYGKKHTEETKNIMKSIWAERKQNGYVHAMQGKTHSAESKAKMSKSQKERLKEFHPKGMKGRTHSDETKAKMSEARKLWHKNKLGKK